MSTAVKQEQDKILQLIEAEIRSERQKAFAEGFVVGREVGYREGFVRGARSFAEDHQALQAAMKAQGYVMPVAVKPESEQATEESSQLAIVPEEIEVLPPGVISASEQVAVLLSS